MKVVFKIDYHTVADEQVCIKSGENTTVLQSHGGSEQVGEIDLKRATKLEYNYAVEGGATPRAEWGSPRVLRLDKGVKSCLVVDRWRDMPSDKSFYSSLFTHSVFKRPEPTSAELSCCSLMVGVASPRVASSQDLYMVGSCEALGAWSVEKGVKMLDGDFPYWTSPSIAISRELLFAEYKFVVVDRVSGAVVEWESGANRNFECAHGVSEHSIYINESPAVFNFGQWRGAGVAIPVFSLRSEESMGVGEFLDLKKMVDWAAMTDQKIIQILPINDTMMGGTWEDSYPYNANSIFALHPQYISLKKVGKLSSKAEMAKVEAEGKRLNALPAVDYEAVNALKSSYLHKIYAQVGAKTMAKRDYKKFFDENQYWLESYALFSLLRDNYSTPDFNKWGDNAVYSQELLESYKAEKSTELGYYYFVQYHLHCQLLEAKEYAASKGVAFKGDIPIGVSRTSVDVWVNPRLFRLDSQAGAPPDDFSVMGQNWGFPTYNWEAMAEDGYAWWKARFAKMAEYFDAYRIDHILGFFRIWEIPLDAVHGLLGYFNPALPYTPAQMREWYGFSFDTSYTKPAINGWLLYHIFGERKAEVENTYLVQNGMDSYTFRAEYNSQVKVMAAVEDVALRDGLMSLFTEVLFVEDPHNAGHFHPRISAHSTFKYQAMSDFDKERYNEMYNDFYYHRHNDYWGGEALKKLPALISATNMLTCGEDLGMIPHCVPYVMESEQILSLEIQRMPKDPKLTFGEPWNYPYRSVCTTSTHDMNPIRAWLREDVGASNRYFREILGIDYAMQEDCPAWVCERIVAQHVASPAMWTILPLQDWLSIDEDLRAKDPESERINVPANSRHYWRYRMHCTLESLLESDAFNARVRELALR